MTLSCYGVASGSLVASLFVLLQSSYRVVDMRICNPEIPRSIQKSNANVAVFHSGTSTARATTEEKKTSQKRRDFRPSLQGGMPYSGVVNRAVSKEGQA